MSRSTNSTFYQSKAWKQVRKNVWLKQSCLCNRCSKPVYVSGITEYIPKEKRTKGIVHHKIYLNNTNVLDDDISLNEDNLEGLCIDCHNKEHFSTNILKNGLMFDEDGNLIQRQLIPPRNKKISILETTRPEPSKNMQEVT